MRIIICNLQMFSNNQTIQIVDTEAGLMHSQTVDVNELPKMVCYLATKYSINDVKLFGAKNEYGEAFAEAIREAHELNFGKIEEFNVEVN